VGVVAAGRAGRIGEDEVRALADGRIFSASDALGNGLVDALGDLEAAVAAAGELAGLPQEERVRVIRYEKRPTGLLVSLSRAEAPVPRSGFRMELSAGGLPLLPFPRFCYLWAP